VITQTSGSQVLDRLVPVGSRHTFALTGGQVVVADLCTSAVVQTAPDTWEGAHCQPGPPMEGSWQIRISGRSVELRAPYPFDSAYDLVVRGDVR
jgi:hypothetical protein